MVWLPDGEKSFDMCNSLDRIPACDRWTSCHVIIRAMHMCRVIKTVDGKTYNVSVGSKL